MRMRYLVTGEQMRAIDRFTIEQIGIPSLVLMERAAMAVAEAAEEEAARMGLALEQCRIQAFCGTGNNGADGIAAARMLFLKGCPVQVILAGEESRLTEECRRQKEIAERLGMEIHQLSDFLPGRCHIVLDALFGVGLSRPLEGEYRQAVQMITDSGACVIAVDMPSGIHSDTGHILGAAVKADRTVSFGYEKLGSALYPGREYCGTVQICDIGFPPAALAAAGEPAACCYEKEDIRRAPRRPEYSNKGTFGKVLAAAGSPNMSGAAYLCALAAYRAGAGLVKILTVEENREILHQLLPEAILSVYDADADPEALREQVRQECAWADVIAAGPGLGTSESSRILIRELLECAYVPVILDADALNILAAEPELTRYLTENMIVTPHLGEMARLTGCSVGSIQEHLRETALQFAREHGVCCVLKDAVTLAAGRDGQLFVNTSGNSCMAKAGSGDVLAGAIAGLLAQGMEPWDAAALGVYLHGLAGDRYREQRGAYSMLAGELAEELGEVMKDAL